MSLNNNANNFQDRSVKVFLNKNAQLFQGKVVNKCQEKNAKMCLKEPVPWCQERLANRCLTSSVHMFQNKHVSLCQRKDAGSAVKTYSGARFAVAARAQDFPMDDTEQVLCCIQHFISIYCAII